MRFWAISVWHWLFSTWSHVEIEFLKLDLWSYFTTASRPEHSRTQTYKSQPETSADITISGDSKTISHQTYKPITGDKRRHQKTHRQTHQRRQAHLINSKKLSSPLIGNLTRVSLLLPYDLLSSSCRSNPDHPITHLDLFFIAVLHRCSSSSDRSSSLSDHWFFLQFCCCWSTKIESQIFSFAF